jgi:hypothetical protein
VHDVVIRDVAEDPTSEDDVGRHGAIVAVGRRCVCTHNFHLIKTRSARACSRNIDVASIQFDETRRNLPTPSVIRKYADHITTLPRAHADDLNAPQPISQGATQLVLHNTEPS